MKLLIKMVYMLALTLFLSCNSSKSFTGEAGFVGPSEPGTILVQAVGYGQSKILAIENAETSALKNILFKGIPGSTYSKAIIPNGSKAESQFKDYFNRLFLEGGYKSFLMTSTVMSPYQAFAKRRGNLNVKVKYNVDALRRDLEGNGVIRKFGF